MPNVHSATSGGPGFAAIYPGPGTLLYPKALPAALATRASRLTPPLIPTSVLAAGSNPAQPSRLSPLTQGASHDDQHFNGRDKVKRTSRLARAPHAPLGLAHQASA